MSENFPRKFALEVVQRLDAAGYQALWAGGCVRDYLMGLSPKDYDVATNATPQQVREIFGTKHTFAVGESFGVIVVIGPGKKFGQVEVATFRQDSETSDGRRPDSVQFCTAQEDAKRRDLTINGLFYDPIADEILDYIGGENDLKQKIIRAIGDAKTRMQEDKLRMLRCVRFTSRFQFQLDEKTANAIRNMSSQLQTVSNERIAEELRKMFKDKNRAFALELLNSLGLFHEIFPELKQCWNDICFQNETDQYFQQMQLPDYQIAFAVLWRNLHRHKKDNQPSRKSSPVKKSCKNLKFSNQETDCIDWLVTQQTALKKASQLPLHQLKPLLAHPHIKLLLEITRLQAVIEGKQPDDFHFCTQYLKATPKKILEPLPLLTGDDLISLGKKPGKEFAEILKKVLHAQLDEQIHTQAEALEMVKLI